MAEYHFPVEDKFSARDVTEADFDITKYPDLIVELEAVRTTNRFNNYKNALKTILGIDPATNRYAAKTFQPTKVLFSGYRGSGKSIELWKLNKELNDPDRYFTVYINIENEIEIEQFEFEDFFIILFVKFIQTLQEYKIRDGVKEIKEIIKTWQEEVEIEKEVRRQASADAEASAKAGFDFLGFFSSNFDLKTAFSASKEFRKTIRTTLRRESFRLIDKFNIALSEAQEIIRKKNLGKAMVFIIDGSEKIRSSIYEQLFIDDSYLLRKIDAKMICTVPINSYFKVEHSNASNFYNNVFLPVVKLDREESIEKFKEIIARRISIERFFEDESVLTYFVKKSGGIIRQLLRLINFAILYMEGDRLNMQESITIVEEYGRRMKERLSKEDLILLEKIKKGEEQLIPGEEKQGKLIFGLFLVKYNGDCAINPVLSPFFDDDKTA